MTCPKPFFADFLGSGRGSKQAAQWSTATPFAAALMSIAIAALHPVHAEALNAQQQLALDIYKELVEIDTTTATAIPGSRLTPWRRVCVGPALATPTSKFSSPRRARAISWPACAAAARASRSC